MEKTEANYLYGVYFTFTNSKYIPKLPLINALLGAFEIIDRAASGVFGLNIQQHKKLEDIGQLYFRYKVYTTLEYSSQLGEPPPYDMLISWMDKVKKEILEAALSSTTEEDIHIIETNWNTWIKEMNLHDSFICNPPGCKQISLLLNTLHRTLSSLGKEVSVELTDRLRNPSEK